MKLSLVLSLLLVQQRSQSHSPLLQLLARFSPQLRNSRLDHVLGDDVICLELPLGLEPQVLVGLDAAVKAGEAVFLGSAGHDVGV